MDRSHLSQLRSLLFLYGVCIVWQRGILAESAITSKHLNMGRHITRIVASNHFTDVYLGGVNFIAQLSSSLGIKVNLTIGPVSIPEHCAPEPAPCDNLVRVLEIDYVHKMLLVCGSAYRGTCTLHSLHAIEEWFCLEGDAYNDSADVVSGTHERNSVVHFLSTSNWNSQLPSNAGQAATQHDCRPKEFGQKYMDINNSIPKYPRIQHHAHRLAYGGSDLSEEALIKRETHETESNVMIAGSAYIPNRSLNPLHLSNRRISYDGSRYTIGYSRGQQSTAVGFQVKDGIKATVTPDYKLSFTWGSYSYFLFLQQTTDCAGQSPCVVTKISRTCQDPSSILPYVEISLACLTQGKTYHLLKSAVIGTVGQVSQAAYVAVPVLLMAFGNSSHPLSSTADPKYGTAICATTLEDLNKYEFDFYLDHCADADGLAKHASWISGSEQNCSKENKQNGWCTTSTKNKYVQGSGFKEINALSHIKDLSVVNILTQTHIVGVDNQGRISLHEIMDVFLLTNSGSMKKISVRVILQGQYFVVRVESHLVDFFNLNDTVRSGSVGITDHAGVVMYLTNGPEIIEFDLEFCQMLQTCYECGRHTEECQWCPTERKCRDKKLAIIICKLSEGRCLPVLSSFAPTRVPTQGGSVLTITGSNLGVFSEDSRVNDSQVNVTICDQPCDNVTANDNSILCTVRSHCETCPTKCDVTVYVFHSNSEGNTSSSNMANRQWVEYLTPIVTSFSPTYGPARGGTNVTFQGQNLHIGSSTTIIVAGSRCDILPPDKCDTPPERCDIPPDSNLICRISEDEKRQPNYGDIRISINNFTTQILNPQFQFRQNPTVRSITPLKTIASGGVTVTVDGMNIDSATLSNLILTVSKSPGGSSSSCTSGISNQCKTAISRNIMTCTTPDISTCSFGKDMIVHLAIYMDDIDVLKQTQLQNMTVYDNPAFVDALIYEHQKILILRGKNIPTWIHRSDITVTFGNTSLNITEVKPDGIICDVRFCNLSKLQTEEKTRTLNFSKPWQTESNETDTIDNADTQDEPFNQVMNNLAATTKHSSGYNTNTSPSRTSRTTRSVTQGGGNKTRTTTVSPRPGRTTTVSHRPGRTSTTKSPPMNKTVKITIKIGNYQQNLDYVTIDYNSNINSLTTEKVSLGHAKTDDVPLIAGAGGAGMLLFLLTVVSCVMYTRAKKARALVKEQAFYMNSLSGSQHGSKEGALPSLKLILQSVIEPDQRADMDRLIISLDCLTVGKSIGSGNFGCVFEGLLSLNKETPAEKVAIKTLQDPSSHTIDLHGFVKEAVLMREFQHPHVLGLIGLAEKEPGIPYVILPYMDNGDLLTFVRDSTVSLSLHDVIKFGADIASGMAYLSTLKFVHRDLAARNCMLDDQYRVKVADFGLCRDIYEKGYYTSDNRKKLPIRWMAVESIEHGAYSSKSDVWSLGVVLWELLSRGVTPYPGVNGWDVINFLRHRRLAPPYFCPDVLYDLMMQCWAKDPNVRPDFVAVQTMLLQMIGQSPTVTDTMKRRRGDNLASSVTKDLNETPAFSKTENTKPEKKPRKIHQVAATKQQNKKPYIQDKNTTAQAEDSDRKEIAYVNVNLSSNTLVKNVLITIPTCYSHRDVSKTAAGIYIQLVDNYEPPPKFSNPFLRSIKKHSKKSHSVHPKVFKKDHDSTADNSAYSVPVEYLPAPDLNSEIVNDDHYRNSEGSVSNRISKDSNYYELENASSRSSVPSDNRSGWSVLCNSGSIASIVEAESQDSFMNISSSSAMSTLSVPYSNWQQVAANRAVGNKPSPLAEGVDNQNKISSNPKVIKQDGSRVKGSDVLTYL